MKVKNVPFTSSMLDVFCEDILKRYKNIEELSRCLILVPSERIVKNLQNTLLKKSNAKAMILPRIVSIQNLDVLLDYSNSDDLLYSEKYQDIFKKIVSKRQRSFILSKLIKQKDTSISITQALAMADSLGDIIDKSYLEEASLKDLEGAYEERLANHWQDIIKFLSITNDFWPSYLKEQNIIDIIFKQNLIYNLQSSIWEKSPPLFPVITLNITSFYPSIIKLLKTIKQMPQGEIYFYGVDFSFKDTPFYQISYQHPQKIIKHTLTASKINYDEIETLYSNQKEEILHKVFNDSIYKGFDITSLKEFTQSLNILETIDDNEEAKIIALSLRHILETPNKTASLITNNKNLIIKVKNELKKWDLEINDYLGEPLQESLHSKFFLLVIQLFKDNFSPFSLLALLKHPFTLFSLERKEVIALCEALDLYIFRIPYGKYNIKSYLDNIKNIKNKSLQIKLKNFLNNIKKEFDPLFKLIKENKKRYNLQEILINHITVAQNISKKDNNFLLWSEQEGKELSTLLAILIEESSFLERVSLQEYIQILEKSIQDATVRSIYDKHPRLYIYGQMQSHLVHHDLMIISSLNEGSNPYLPFFNPWMNKAIENSIGFLPNEHIIGLQANTFLQNLGAKEILLTRSLKQDNELTNPSRWLLKITTLLKYYFKVNEIKDIKEINNKEYLQNIQKNLRMPDTFEPLKLTKLEINPDISLRPLKISATGVETLLKNPYIFFIEKILKLRKLEELSPTLKGAIYGSKIHLTLERFLSKKDNYINLSKEQNKSILQKIAEEEFKDSYQDISFFIFKKPVIEKSLNDFLDHNFNHFTEIKEIFTEVKGEIDIVIDDINLTITGVADRIDIKKDNKMQIIDYKTSKPKIEEYFKQLLILSLILNNKGFKDIKILADTINADYLFLPRNLSDKLETKNNNIKNIKDYLAEFKEELFLLLEKYYKKRTPYNFNIKDKYMREYKQYARVEEWNIDSSMGEEDEN